MAKVNSINNTSDPLTIDPGASGDSFVQFDINATGEFRIGVDDTDDSFRISQGSALGTNDTFIITTAGERSKPLQPTFLAILTSTITNVTGNATWYTIVWDTEVFDQNGDFSSTTFTAPITGRYYLQFQFIYSGIGTLHDTEVSSILTSNVEYRPGFTNPYALRDSNAEVGSNGCVIADMDASDTASILAYVSGSSQVVDIFSNGSADPWSWFSGSLLC